MDKKEKKYLKIAIVAIVIGFAATEGGLLKGYGINPLSIGGSGGSTTTTPPPTTGTVPTGVVQLVATGQDIYNPSSTTYTCGATSGNSTFDATYYGLRSGAWVRLGACGTTSSPTQFEITAQDGGYIYIVAGGPAGASGWVGPNTYLQAQKTQTLNARAVSMLWTDVDNNGDKEFVLKWNMFNLPAPTSGFPESVFIGYYFQWSSWGQQLPGSATSATYAQGASIAACGGSTAPAAPGPTCKITSIGTTAKQIYIQFNGAFSCGSGCSNTYQGVAISQIDLTFNATSSQANEINLLQQNVPGIGYLSGSQLSLSLLGGTSTDNSDNLRYRWQAATNGDIRDQSQANYMFYGPNQANFQDFTTQLSLTLSSGDKINCKLTVYVLTPSQTIVSSIMDVSLNA